MKYLFYLLATMLIVLAMLGCNTSRRTIRSERSKDSSYAATASTVQNTLSSERIRIKDTTLYFGKKYTDEIVRPQDLTPLYDATGKPQPRVFESKHNGLTAKLTINPDSSATFSATMDSFVLVVQNLVERTNRLERQNSSTSAVKETVKEALSYSEVIKKSGGLLARFWPYVLVVLGIIFLPQILDYLRKLYSFIKPKNQ